MNRDLHRAAEQLIDKVMATLAAVRKTMPMAQFAALQNACRGLRAQLVADRLPEPAPVKPSEPEATIEPPKAKRSKVGLAGNLNEIL